MGAMEALVRCDHPFGFAGRSEGVQAHALTSSQTLTVRFGRLWLVQICVSELEAWDSTNVDKIQFAAGSAQLASWEARLDERIFQKFSDATWYTFVFNDSPIQVDTTGLERGTLDIARPYGPNDQPGKWVQSPESRQRTRQSQLREIQARVAQIPEEPQPRRRRDIVGEHLLLTGTKCEQWGNALIVQPRSAKSYSD